MVRLRQTLLLLLTASTATCCAQEFPGYAPISEKLPPGYSADMLARIRAGDPYYLQPVRVELPTTGTVSVYSATPDPLATIAAPAQFSVNAGHFYRLRVADMPEFPGVEVYPSIEILDRLHPPAGQEANYPIPLILSQSDLQEAINGRMVTRIVYLEQPQLASTLDPLRRDFRPEPDPAQNALQEADRLGRPMVIVRIGGRTPDGPDMPLSFYGSGGSFDLGASPETSGVNVTQRSLSRHSVMARIAARE